MHLVWELVHGILIDICGSGALSVVALSADHDLTIIGNLHGLGSALREPALAGACSYGDGLADAIHQIGATRARSLHQADRGALKTPTRHFARRSGALGSCGPT